MVAALNVVGQTGAGPARGAQQDNPPQASESQNGGRDVATGADNEEDRPDDGAEGGQNDSRGDEDDGGEDDDDVDDGSREDDDEGFDDQSRISEGLSGPSVLPIA